MPPILNAADRKAMSRRLVKLDLEIEAMTTAQTNSGTAETVYDESDDMNKVLMDFYQGISASYEDEKRDLNGTVAATFTETDVQDSAAETYGNMFFPRVDGGTPNNPHLIPGTVDTTVPPDGITDGFVDSVNGITTSTDTDYEEVILTRLPGATAPSGNGLVELDDLLRSGFNFGAGSSALGAIYNIGDTAVTLALSIGTSPGEYIYIHNASNSLLAVVLTVGGGGTNLTVYPIMDPGANIPALGSTVSRVFAGFTLAERNSLVASSAFNQDILDGLTTTGPNNLIAKVALWETKVDAENTSLAGNEEERAVKQAENAAAVVANNATKAVIDTWQAFSNTGVNGKFTDNGMNPLMTEVASRQGVVATRIAEIVDSLGLLTDNGDGTYSVTSFDDIYPERYTMLNLRINRGMGTLKRKLNAQKSDTLLGQIVGMLQDSQIEYDSRMVATKLASNGDGTKKIEVKDGTGFSVNDTVYVVSETQGELSGSVRFINGNMIDLSFAVSSDYITDDLARLYKVL